jgi:tetratricopeptide (TPR) repeat protein
MQPGNHIITGQVRDSASLDGLPGVRVQLVVAGDKLAAPPQTSNTDGQFQIYCGKTDYYILADKDGYLPARVKITLEPGWETRITIDLLRKSPQEDAAGPGETVSAHQLTMPPKAREAFGQGLALLNSQKDYPAAVSRFQAAIQSCPSYYEAYAEMGIAEYYAGDATAAEQAFRKSIELSDQKYSYAVSDLAELLNNTRRFADAEPVARQAVALDNSSSRANFELARALLGLKRPADAEQFAAKSRDLEPDYPLVHIVLADIHLTLHDYPAVVQDADAYLKLVPDGPVSDQVRKTRQQVARALGKNQPQSAANHRP